jgi:Polyketide cyclase / dehydrase and lipid transport
MTDESVSATTVIDASAEAIFAILAEPAKHAAIDGTGWVCEPLDGKPLTAAGQVFRMSMYHPYHPDGHYQVANQIQVFDPPSTISWKPGTQAEDGKLSFGGWIWGYDLTPAGPSKTSVTLSYDWSAVPDPVREHIGFPPFPPEHLSNSLVHLTKLVTS